MSLFTQLFCRYPALQDVRGCNGRSISRRQYFTALLHILFLLHIFCPIFQNGSWVLGGGHDTDVSFGAKHSAVIHSHCFHQLWVSGFIVPHWKKEASLVMGESRDTLMCTMGTIAVTTQSAPELPCGPAFVVSTICGWMLKGRCPMGILKLCRRRAKLQVFFSRPPIGQSFLGHRNEQQGIQSVWPEYWKPLLLVTYGQEWEETGIQSFKTLIYSERAGNLRRWHPAPSSSLASSLLSEKKVWTEASLLPLRSGGQHVSETCGNLQCLFHSCCPSCTCSVGIWTQTLLFCGSLGSV